MNTGKDVEMNINLQQITNNEDKQLKMKIKRFKLIAGNFKSFLEK